MNDKLLKVNNLSYSVRGESGRIHILNNLSFELEKNKALGIAGESGSGKTTLGKLLAGILQPTEGEINFNFDSQHKNRKTNRVQILFQNNGEILNPFRKVSDVVDEAIRIKSPHIEVSKTRAMLFNSLNFPKELWNRKGFELSGGEQQRAALARLLAVEPELLILDEPFSAQDPESQLNFLNLFKKIKDEFNVTLICIAHNLRILRRLCNEIIIIYKGELIEKGETEEILNSPKHPYTKFLLSAEDYNLTYEELKKSF
jgi:ABC-type dipeptide/oligopeptide/nickel transport system ATPase subunit